MESTQISLDINYVVSVRMKDETAKTLNVRPINTNPYFQRLYEAWPLSLKVGLIQSILLGYILNPIWLIENDDDECSDVLDGQHRLRTISDFIENKFQLVGKHLNLLSKEIYDKKFFKDLTKQDQTKFRNYKVYFNILDSSNQDDEKIEYWYTVLNKSSKPLNPYEQLKPVRSTLYKFLEEFEKDFIMSPVFKGDSNIRGNLHTTMLKLLALTEPLFPEKYSSVECLKDKWIEKTFGTTKSDVDVKVLELEDAMKRKMKTIIKYMNFFKETGLITQESNVLCAGFVCVRLCALLPQKFLLRHSEQITTQLKQEIFDKPDILLFKDLSLKKFNRNQQFQRHLIMYIDSIIKSVLGDDIDSKRLFTKSDIQKKLEEQKYNCTLCLQPITKEHKYEGDHIVSWCSGGKTEYDNLQVVHWLCHVKK